MTDATHISFADDPEGWLRGKPTQPPAPRPPAPVIPIGNGNTNRDRKYAEGALQAECNGIAGMAPNSGRNHALNAAKFNLARFINAGILTNAEVDNALTAAALTSGLPQSEIDDCLKGDRHQRAVAQKRGDQPAVPPPSPEYAIAPAYTLEDETDAENPGSEPQVVNIWGTRPPIDAAEFLFSETDEPPALWGDGDNVLWVEGEVLMICGGMGLGKTTLAGQVLRAQIVGGGDVLGLPVAPVDGTILYLAMDRPRQIRRSLLRQFDITDSDALHKLLIRPGPPIADLAVNTTLLAAMAEAADAQVVYVDSLKDAAIGLSDDKVGAAYNRARQELIASGRQICELHHNRKVVAGNTPGSIAEVYGSTWLSAGAGSIINLTGDPGDPIINFRHVKQALNEVGPWRLLVDHDAGRMTIDHQVDLLALAAAAGPDGLTVEGAAAALFDGDKPSKAQQQKARRKLDKLVDSGHLTRHEGAHGGGVGRPKTAWFPASSTSFEAGGE